MHAVACAAVLALTLLAPVLAEARTTVPALALLAPVLAGALAAVLALALPAPVLAQMSLLWGALFRNSSCRRLHCRVRLCMHTGRCIICT
jgi:hypothetical protein